MRGKRYSYSVCMLLGLVTLICVYTVYQVHEHQSDHVGNTANWHSRRHGMDRDRELMALAAVDKEDNTMMMHQGTDHTTPAMCHVEEQTELDGGVVKWGFDFFVGTAGECCTACSNTPDCNVWVWCGSVMGCGVNNDRRHGECWLKKATLQSLREQRGRSSRDIRWVSGSLFDDAEMAALEDKEAPRLKALRENKDLPLVYFDVAIDGVPVGRIEMVLFMKESPRSAENFRALCTGEKGIVPKGHEGEGKKYHFKGNSFYRIIDRFIDQAGAWTDSVYGGTFKDDEGGLKLKHDRKGLLSMANAGPDTNDSHFSILMGPAPHLDGHYTIFGEVVSGFEVALKVNALSKGKPENTAGTEVNAVIVDSGQIR
mmetsp:Transcript_31020/g.68824  ORF Transcript_31020/g.68824 Transcript_31020/m.68824 type:complete len:370 (-) Transcript_31020:184-1293(-)